MNHQRRKPTRNEHTYNHQDRQPSPIEQYMKQGKKKHHHSNQKTLC